VGGGSKIYIIVKSFCIKEIITFASVLYRYTGSQRDHLPKPLCGGHLHGTISSWESNRCFASQEIPRILWRLNFAYDEIVKVKNQLDATKYAILLPQHVTGTNMPTIRSLLLNLLFRLTPVLPEFRARDLR
jgi:hypothetical protein